MMILAAMLFGLSTGCAAWVFVNQRQNQRLIVQRIGAETSANASTSAGNYLDFFRRAKKAKSTEISLENMNSDKISHDLFLAGVHDPKIARIFRMVIRFSGGLPLFLIGVNALTGHLTLRSAISDGAAGLIIFVYVHFILRIAKQKRQKQILRSLPQILDLLVVCVEAGLGFTAAVERILKEVNPRDPLTKELNLMYHEFLGGLSLSQACKRMDKRCEVVDLSLLLTSIVQSDQMGSSLGYTLRTQASEIRDKFKQRVRAKALQIPVKILFPMIPIFLAFMLLNFSLVGYQMTKAIGGQHSANVEPRAKK